jgi:segregation and condensation protein A
MEAVNTPQPEKLVLAVDKFEGPLDLLWNLIRESKLDITEISLSMVTEQYIHYLRLMDTLNIQVAAEFIVMASELLYYKSKALLPAGEMEDEYFVQPLPPNLVQKLLEYKKFQAAAEDMRSLFENQSDCFSRPARVEELAGDELYLEVSLFDLLKAFAEVIDSQETIEQEEIVFDEVLVSDRISFIESLLADRESVLFEEMFPPAPGRAVIIASFLAVLEMSRMRRIRIMQHRLFGEIRIFRAAAEAGTPVDITPSFD